MAAMRVGACLLVLAEIISSTLKMEATCSSETSVATRQAIRRYIPEDDTFHHLIYFNYSHVEACSGFTSSVLCRNFKVKSV
jgi:hypothetical protein